MPSDPVVIEKTTILIVEGIEDQLVLEELSKHIQITEIQILPIGGKTLLDRNLLALTSTPGFVNVKSIGIIRDGDDNPVGGI